MDKMEQNSFDSISFVVVILSTSLSFVLFSNFTTLISILQELRVPLNL